MGGQDFPSVYYTAYQGLNPLTTVQQHNRLVIPITYNNKSFHLNNKISKLMLIMMDSYGMPFFYRNCAHNNVNKRSLYKVLCFMAISGAFEIFVTCHLNSPAP